MALADCAETIYADVAKNSRIELTSLEAVAEATKTAALPKLADVMLKVRASWKASEKLLQAAWRKTEKICPVLYIQGADTS